jgi:hypothetical protein
MKGGSSAFASPAGGRRGARHSPTDRMASSGVRVHPLADLGGFPIPPEPACAGCSRRTAIRFDATFDDRPIPPGAEREDTGTHQPTIDHGPVSADEKQSKPTGCPNFALRLMGDDANRVNRQNPPVRKVGRRRDSFPNESLIKAWRFRPRGAYMPGRRQSGKVKIYNPAGNVRSGSQAAWAVGKMFTSVKPLIGGNG